MDAMSDVNESSLMEKWMPRHVVSVTLFVVGLLVSLALLFMFRTVVMMLFVAILFGTGLKPAVNFLAARGMSRNYGQILIYVVLFAVFLGFMVLALTPVLEQSASVTSLARTYYTDVRLEMLKSQSTIIRNLGIRLSPNLEVQDLAVSPDTTPPTAEETAAETARLVSTAFNFVGIIAKALLLFVAISLMTFYWTLESERVFRTLLMLFPSSKRANIREVIDAVEGKLGAYLFGQGILMVAIGILSLVAYLIIGLPNALVLALIAGVMDRSVGVSPLLTILSIAALSSLLGLPGVILAVPIAAIIQFLINRYVITPVREPDLKPQGRDNLSYLRLQIQELANDSRKQVPGERSEGEEEQGEGRIEEPIGSR